MEDQARKDILTCFGEAAAQYYDNHFLINGGIEFVGMNCHDCCDDIEDEDYCTGWDGSSRRCYCGNRRVNWEWDGETLWAEAW